ncbi:phage tail length tape measure family protein [Phyllobacterium sp. K27]
MAELATLGIEAKATGVDQAAKAMDRLTGAAQRVEAATSSIGPTSAKAGAMAAQAANSHATALNAEAAAATKAAGAMRVHTQAANQNIRGSGAAAANVGNLAAQFQDIGVSAAMSMNPLQIALQQGTQISAVLGPMGAAGALKSLGNAFLSVISPVSLVTIGLVAAVAAGLQVVNWAKIGAAALVGLADSLQVIAPYAMGAAAALALLYAPAIIGGIVQVIALLGRMAVAATIAAATMAAANPGLAFILGVTAAVAAANLFRDELTQIFGFDIVKAAKDGVNAIIATFVGAYQGIKATWKQLPSAIGDIVYQTVNATIKGVESMINSVVKLMNTYIGGLYNSIGGLASKLGVDIGSFSEIGQVSFGGVDNPYAGAASSVDAGIADAIKSAQGTDYVGNFGSAIAKGASAASAKLKEMAKDLLSVEDKSKKKKGAGGKTDEEKYSDIVKGAERRIASLKAEQAAVGLTEEAASKLRFEQDLLNQAQQKGIILTAAQKTELSGLAGTMASTEAATKKAQEALDFAKDATGGFLSDLRSGLQNGEGFFKSFGNAALNVLDKIVNKIQDDLVDALFSIGGSGGGYLSSLFGGLFGGGFKVTPGAGLFASGGYTGNGAANQAAGIVHGGEYVFSKKATMRLGVGNLEAMHNRAKGYASGGYVATTTSTPAASASNNTAPQGIHVTIGWAPGSDGDLKPVIRSVSREVANDVSSAHIDQYNRQVLPARVNQINEDPHARG